MAKLTASATYTDAELLDLYRECYARISVGQSYRIGDRMLTRADLAEVMKQIAWLEARIEQAANGPILTKVRRLRAS